MPGRDTGQNPATRTFQAIRIHINRELEELSLTLPLVADRLTAGGRLVVIAFHSLEDRLVKRFMRQRSNPPPMPAKLPLRADQIPVPGMRLIGRAVRPSEAEIAKNPRARSAVMRTIEMAQP
jgi:16S rRNA (cytosine1402-N4)-methyltransferase